MQQGARLPGATVAAVHLESRTRVQALTDAEGRYHLPALRLGMHEVTVELSGFKRVLQPDVMAALGERLQLDFVLEVGGLTESITVSGDAPLLQVTTAEISDVVSNEQILQMPLNARDVLALAPLSDAVVLPPGGTRGEALQQAGPLPNVGGQRSGHNIYLLDGVKVTDELFNNLVISPSVDSVQEFKIQKSQYAAEFGGKASALINVATRAGTNQLHGSAFEFLRHERVRLPRLLRPRRPAGAVAAAASVRRRRRAGRSCATGRSSSRATRASGCGASRRARSRCPPRPRAAATWAPCRIDPARIDPIVRRAAAVRAAAEPAWRAAEPGGHRGAAAGSSTQFSVRLDHRVRSGPASSSRASARSTPTRCSRSGRARCRKRWCPASAAA